MCYYSERISLKVGILLVEVARMRCENQRTILKPSEQEGGTRWQNLKNCPECQIHILVS